MKKRLWMVAVAIAALAGLATCSDSVEPQSATATFVRGAGGALQATVVPYRGTVLNLTNCVLCTTNAATVQGLSGVTVEVAVGNMATSQVYTATVQSAALGTWHCTITVPDLAMFEVQVKITDSVTNTYIYPSRGMSTQQSLFE